jgi:crossover junction endodeoxyribonuclease RuvC
LIEVTGAQVRHLDHGVIEVRGAEFPLRLRQIARAVERLVGALDADLALEVAVERAFMHRNADSALKLAQARGAALAALPEPARVFEYAPRAVKQSTVGFGAADKLQVASMVAQLLGLPPDAAQADAADALAVALCHAQTRRLGQLLAAHS